MYGHGVTVYTDSAAVKAVLDAPDLDGKHARWWNKVHGSEIREVDMSKAQQLPYRYTVLKNCLISALMS